MVVIEMTPSEQVMAAAALRAIAARKGDRGFLLPLPARLANLELADRIDASTRVDGAR